MCGIQICTGLERQLHRFHIGLGVFVSRTYYSTIVTRYAIYYSPGGNQYGGYIDNSYRGYYYMASLFVNGGYTIYENNRWRFDIDAGLGGCNVSKIFTYAGNGQYDKYFAGNALFLSVRGGPRV